MATNDDLDLDEEKKSSKKWIIIISAILVLLIGAGAGLYFSGMLPFGEGLHEGGEAGEAPAGKNGEKGSRAKTASFYEFEPFIVNFPRGGEARLLQVNFSVLTHDDKTTQIMAKHAPMLRNSLLLLLGRYAPEDLKSIQGKEALRQAIIQEIQKVLDLQQVEDGSVEAVFFTQFVMQ